MWSRVRSAHPARAHGDPHALLYKVKRSRSSLLPKASLRLHLLSLSPRAPIRAHPNPQTLNPQRSQTPAKSNPPSISRPISAPRHRAGSAASSRTERIRITPRFLSSRRAAGGRARDSGAPLRVATPLSRPGWWRGRRGRRRDLTLAPDLGAPRPPGARRNDLPGTRAPRGTDILA
jgi:hypothetical protein